MFLLIQYNICVRQHVHLHVLIGMTTTFYTLVPMLSFLFPPVALRIVTCRLSLIGISSVLIAWTTSVELGGLVIFNR